jgi:hypothetical protein
MPDRKERQRLFVEMASRPAGRAQILKKFRGNSAGNFHGQRRLSAHHVHGRDGDGSAHALPHGGSEFRLEFRLNFREFPEIFQRKFGSSRRLQREKHRQAQRGDAGVSGAA